MKKIILILTYLTALLFLCSCGVKLKTIDKGLRFSKNTTFTIAQEDDITGSVKEVSYLLAQKGFNVISYSNAKNAIEFKNDLSKISKLKDKDIVEVYSVKDTNSIYNLELGYKYYYDIFNYAYSKFSFRIVDLKSGNVVMYGYFRNGVDTATVVLKDFVEKLYKL